MAHYKPSQVCSIKKIDTKGIEPNTLNSRCVVVKCVMCSVVNTSLWGDIVSTTESGSGCSGEWQD